MKNSDQTMTILDGFTIVPEPSKELLKERAYLNYRSKREQCLNWCRSSYVFLPEHRRKCEQ